MADFRVVVRRPSPMRRPMHRFTSAAILLLLLACWSYLPTTHAGPGSAGGTPFIKTISGSSGYTCVDPNGCLIRCTGKDACKDSTIRCDNPTGPCLIECTGEGACSGNMKFMGSIPATSPVVIRCSLKE